MERLERRYLPCAILIEKETEGLDADDPTGPLIAVGELADFRNNVSNPGNVPMDITSGVDNNGTPDDDTDNNLYGAQIGSHTRSRPPTFAAHWYFDSSRKGYGHSENRREGVLRLIGEARANPRNGLARFPVQS
jgi:hypothetical protein